MTCIAWDGHVLAADKRCVSSGGLPRTCTKIIPWKDCLIGITGDWDVGAEMREWFMSGADPKEFPKEARGESKATLLVIKRGEILQFNAGPVPMRIENFRTAWGSGRDFAIAAMHLDHDARSAVSVACEFSVDCGNGITCLQLPPEEET